MKTYNKFLETPFSEDKKWIQKATKNMRKDKPCTGEKFGSETCPPGSKRYNLAKTFRKMAKEQANSPEPPKKESDDPSIKAEKKKEGMLKKRVLMQKLRAVRSGVEGIVAHHEPEGELVEGDVHSGQGEKIQKRTKKWMDKKGQKGAPGLDAMKARTAEHKAKRGVKEEKDAYKYVVSKLKAKYGDGVLTKGDKIKPQSAADKAKARAHQAKVDAENAAERKKDPSQGRYPKG